MAASEVWVRAALSYLEGWEKGSETAETLESDSFELLVRNQTFGTINDHDCGFEPCDFLLNRGVRSEQCAHKSRVS